MKSNLLLLWGHFSPLLLLLMPMSSLIITVIVICSVTPVVQAFSIAGSSVVAKKAAVSCKMSALPKLYSTIDEIESDLQKGGCASTSQNDNGGEKSDGSSSINCVCTCRSVL